MNKLSDKKNISMLSLLCCMVYFVSYLTRLNYNAVINDIVSLGVIEKSMAGVISTASFVSYGAGQLFCGFIGDRVNPKRMITAGLIATSLLNIAMPFAQGGVYMAVIWCLNGLPQAMMWPPIVRILSESLKKEDYARVIVNISFASLFGTVAVYIAAAFCTCFISWQSLFIICAGFGISAAIVWSRRTSRLPIQFNSKAYVEKPPCEQEEKRRFAPRFVLLFLVPVALMIILQGILRDGVTTWMPNYLTEVFSLDSSASILTVIVLPLFSLISVKAASALFIKLKNEIVSAVVFYLIAFLAAILLLPLFSSSILLCVLLMSLLTGCMHSINALLISYLPARFAKFGRASTATGAFNACSYIGSGLSGFGIAILSQQLGWYFTIAVWAAVAFAGLLIGLLTIRQSKKLEL